MNQSSAAVLLFYACLFAPLVYLALVIHEEATHHTHMTQLVQILNHMHNLDSNALSPLNLIYSPTPQIATPLVQRHPTKRGPHLEPLESRNNPLDPLPGTCLTVPHHHSPEPPPRGLGRREDSPDTRALCLWVPYSRDPQLLRRRRGAKQRAPIRPAAAREEDVRGVRGGQYEIRPVGDELRIDAENVADGAAERGGTVVACAKRRHAVCYEGLQGWDVGR
jgi:hypothetical protein